MARAKANNKFEESNASFGHHAHGVALENQIMGGATARGSMMNDGKRFPRSFSGRPIPKRGQVKAGIVMGLANSVAGIFSRTASCAAPPHLSH
ncbi:hypothetical protein VNO77_22043 [Canavalia gladiata]|uniref:Uncharacterized protein n=1 Tax=Canavalia gladiata TaxID=3824 RepID=A0AAN9Q7N9_CANGL